MTRTGRPVERRGYAGWFFIVSLALVLVTVWAVYNETVTRRPWKKYQREFFAMELASIESELAAARKSLESAATGAEREKLEADYDQLRRRRDQLISTRPQIQQIVVPGLGAVDRCGTCHLALERPGLDGPGIKEPFRTHPDLDTLLGHNHPPEKFGCTICHRGEGPQTKGIGRRPFDHGRSDPYWDRPMLRPPFTESSCGPCHYEEWELERAPALNRGKQIYADLACYACHLTSGFEKGRRMGPSLLSLSAKINPDWLLAWLRRPRDLRPRTRMPNCWPGAVDREGKTRAGSEEAATRDAEVKAIAAFILDAGDAAMPLEFTSELPGDTARGRSLFIDRGCLGCHRPAALNLPPLASQASLTDYGPDLSDVGSKTSPQWIAAFLSNPSAFFRETRMPDMRLSGQDISDLSSFLATLTHPGLAPAPPVLKAPDPIEKGRERAAYFGCDNCHELKGFEATIRVGPELDGFGDKPPAQLSFGDTVTDPAAQTWPNWTRLKLENPRLFNTSNITLKMPDNELMPEEITALMVYLQSLAAVKVNPDYVRRLSPNQSGEAAGARLLREYNCRGCHLIEGQGGDVRLLIRDPGLVPPDLTGEGAKIQPAWLFQFLKQPVTLRPWLKMRMPTFGFTDLQANLLVRYFMARSREEDLFVEVPLEQTPELMAQTAQAFVTLKCLQCHQLTVGPEIKLSDLAPDMALTRYRLRPQWVTDFVLDPQRLMPGTKMPTFFPLEDDEDPNSLATPLPSWLRGNPRAQIRAVTEYLYLLKSQDALAVPDQKPQAP
ncbi:MAG TPA: c-type cytochrome [bacterium]|nr:c-type cytochrome [bacterium]